MIFSMSRSFGLPRMVLAAVISLAVVLAAAPSAVSSPSGISAGTGFSCVIDAGAIRCKGAPPLSGPFNQSFKAAPAFSAPVTDYSAGRSHSCAVAGGVAYCWGSWNYYGELGNFEYPPPNTPTQVVGLPTGVDQLDVNDFESCAIASGAAWCWGRGSSGELGDGTRATDRRVAAPVTDLTAGVSDISVGQNHVCAVVSAHAWCWGSNFSGQLGTGDHVGRAAPIEVDGLTDVTAVAAGDGFSCAVASGVVKCWGKNDSGQLGSGLETASDTPVEVSGIDAGATAIAAGRDHACAIVATVVKCWGGSHHIGRGLLASSKVPVQVAGLPSGVSELDASKDHSCAITGGRLYCWGEGGGVGLGGYGFDPAPSVYLGYEAHLEFGATRACWIKEGAVGCQGEEVGFSPSHPRGGGSDTLSADVEEVSLGRGHSCAIEDGAAVCWGGNILGQLGIGLENDPNREGSYYPEPVAFLEEGVTDIAAGAFFSCAVVDAAAACWGFNGHGQLGRGDTDDSDGYADLVTGLDENVTAVAAGDDFACAIVASAVKCWGSNDRGQLGDGSSVDSPEPVVAVGLDGGVTAIAARGSTVCAVKSGSLFCWGANTDGMLGDGSSVDRDEPIQVSGLTTGVTTVSVGARHACAVAASAIKCWGSDIYGQLGDGKARSSTTPVDVLGMGAEADDVSAGFDQTCGVANGNTRCWGFLLGSVMLFGTLKPVAEPTLLGPTTEFIQKPPKFDNDSTPSFELGSSDPDATFVCDVFRWGNASKRDAQFVLGALNEGSHSIACWAVGSDGYADPRGVEYAWATKQTPPAIAIEYEELGGARFRFQFSAGLESLTNATCALDAGIPESCESGWESAALAVGSHTFRVRAEDRFGNQAESGVTFWVLQPQAPAAPAGNGDAGKAGAAPKSWRGATLRKSDLAVRIGGLETGDRVSATLTLTRSGRSTKAASRQFRIGASPTKALHLKLTRRATRLLRATRKNVSARFRIVVRGVDGKQVVIVRNLRLKRGKIMRDRRG